MNLHTHIIPFFKTHAVVLSIALLCLFTQLFSLNEIMRFDRLAIENGELWRLLTSNFIHLTWTHLGMNMGALGLISLLFSPRMSLSTQMGVIVISSILLNIGIFYLNPELTRLVGFSGTIHGVMLAGCWRELRYDKLMALLALALTISKLGYEQIYGPMPGSSESAGGPVAVDAHLYGAITGFVFIVIVDLYLKRRNKQT